MPESTRKPLSRRHAGVRTRRHSHFEPDRRAWGGSGHAPPLLWSGPAPSYRLAGELAASPARPRPTQQESAACPSPRGRHSHQPHNVPTNVHQWDIVCENKGPTAPHSLEKKEKKRHFWFKAATAKKPRRSCWSVTRIFYIASQTALSTGWLGRRGTPNSSPRPSDTGYRNPRSSAGERQVCSGRTEISVGR